MASDTSGLCLIPVPLTSGLMLTCTRGQCPSPQPLCAQTLRGHCSQFSCNPITNTCLSNLFLQTVLLPGTTCLCCRRDTPKRVGKGTFHFEMGFYFDSFISLLLCYCKLLEYLDCRIMAISNKSNISCAFVVSNVPQGPFSSFLVLICSCKEKTCTYNSSVSPFPQFSLPPKTFNLACQ